MSSIRDPNWRLRGFARVMRHAPTKGEDKLWEMLRDRRLGGYKFRRQVPIDGYIMDFYCMEKRVAVELDGEQHHEREAVRYDERRDGHLKRRDIRVLRFPSIAVFNEPTIVRESILEALDEEPSPQPSPGVPGEGERR